MLDANLGSLLCVITGALIAFGGVLLGLAIPGIRESWKEENQKKMHVATKEMNVNPNPGRYPFHGGQK